jgi:hypothetical protein
MRTQEQDEEWRVLGGGGRLIGMRLGFAGGRRKVIYVFVGLSGCYFKWATITRGSPWCPCGEKFAPASAPITFRGPAPHPSRGKFCLRPCPVRVESPRGSVPAGKIAIPILDGAHVRGALLPSPQPDANRTTAGLPMHR